MVRLTRKEMMLGMAGSALATSLPRAASARPGTKGPRAITMWDFSWLERRWPGAGYEDWDQALDELVERGYDAIRIDCYPHLIAVDPRKSWLLKPVWNVQDWGAPTFTRVQVVPALHEFIGKCKQRGIKIGLSTWFREDADNIRNTITTPEKHAEIWRKTLRSIREAGLLDAILYVDLCNEWPGKNWATFLQPPLEWGAWRDPRSLNWMRTAIASLRGEFPDLPLLFSGTSGRIEDYASADTRIMDAIEYHIWMVNGNGSEFNKAVGYDFALFSEVGYHNLQMKAADLYRSREEYWKSLLVDQIARAAAASRISDRPMMTTECWGIVDYKDWPLLPWDWVKELCSLGTLSAAATGRWLAMGTSNFCGPQFHGMWRDVAWHRTLTTAIKTSKIDAALATGRLWDRL